MHIVITECGSAANIGSMALIENAMRIARRIDSQCTLTILTSDVDRVRKSLNSNPSNKDVNIKFDLFKFPEGTNFHKIIWLFNNVLWIILVRLLCLITNNPHNFLYGRKADVLQTISKADYVICIGAERINDVYYKTAYLSLEALDIYEKMRAKLIHFSLTIGPIFYKSTYKKAAKVLNKSYAIFVRDQKSYDLLKELNVSKPQIVNSFDIAILQQKLPDYDEHRLFIELGIDKNNKYVCVSVIDWLFRKAKGPVRQAEYNQSVAQTLDYIIEKYNIKIVFTPTVVGIYKVDDVTAARNIMTLMKHKNEVIAIEKLLSPQELATVFSHCYFSIVTRMHAAILCTGAGNRPIIAINYLYKLREYMKNIGFEEYSVDIDYTNTSDLIQFVDNMINNYDENQNKLTIQLDKMKASLLHNIDTFLDTYAYKPNA